MCDLPIVYARLLLNYFYEFYQPESKHYILSLNTDSSVDKEIICGIFLKLFLLHMDDITTNVADQRNSVNQPVGCSTICVNQPNNVIKSILIQSPIFKTIDVKQEILGHTEDALRETLNHFYIVSAHIISDTPQGKYNVTEERYTSLCYAGHLPGYTMGYNHHGLVFTINTLSAKTLYSGKTREKLCQCHGPNLI